MDQLVKLRAELAAMKMTGLRRRARDAGVPEEVLEAAEDSEEPRAQIVSLLLEAHREAEEERSSRRSVTSGLAELRAELSTLGKLSALRKRAAAAEIDNRALEEAEDSEEPRAAMVALLLEAHVAAQAQETDHNYNAAGGVMRHRAAVKAAKATRLVEELSSMKLSALRKRAMQEGLESKAIEAVYDSDDPQRALIALMVQQSNNAVENDQDDKPTTPETVVDADATKAAEKELTAMKTSALRKRAVAAKIDSLDLEAVDDADDPKAAIIALLLGAHVSSESDAAGEKEAAEKEALLAELTAMKTSALRKRAVAAKIDSLDLEAVDDADDPKAAIIALLLGAHVSSESDAAGEKEAAEKEALLAELTAMKTSALRKRAVAAKIDSLDLEAVDDADDPKAAIIALLVRMQLSVTSGTEAKATRPHFGSGQHRSAPGPTRPAEVMPPAGLGRPSGPVPKGKHVMLSYK